MFLDSYVFYKCLFVVSPEVETKEPERTIKNNYITYSKTGTKWFITEDDLWELLRSIQVRCLDLRKDTTKGVSTTKLKTPSISQMEGSSELGKVQNALRMKTQNSMPLKEKKNLSRNLKIEEKEAS